MNAVVDAHKEATGRSVMQELKDMIKEQERAAKLDEESASRRKTCRTKLVKRGKATASPCACAT